MFPDNIWKSVGCTLASQKLRLQRICSGIPVPESGRSWKVKRAQLFATPWSCSLHQAPSMGFSRHEYWSELLSFPYLPNPGSNQAPPHCGWFGLPSEPPGRTYKSESGRSWKRNGNLIQYSAWIPRRKNLAGHSPGFAKSWHDWNVWVTL